MTEVETRRPGLMIERVEVPNDGFMADQPTNAYLVGTRELLIVDPGSTGGEERILAALAARPEATAHAIVLTHAHPDHAQAAPPLKRALGVPLYLHPGNQPILPAELRWEDIDEELTGGMTLPVAGGLLEVVDTPGHAPGHVALFDHAGGTLLAGDLVSGNGSIGIFPPHGSMLEYLASLRRARALPVSRILPGHGPEIADGPALLDQYVAHRLNREREVYEAVAREPRPIETLVAELYPDVLPQFRRAAGATVLAHLQKLQAEGRVRSEGDTEDLRRLYQETIWRATA